MYTIIANNVNDGLAEALRMLKHHGVVPERPTRNGPVVTMEEPCMVQIGTPQQRVLFSSVRNANPFFHFMEAIWMLAGRNDIAWLTRFNKRMIEFSDDGVTQHAAYGHRWRKHFEIDQLYAVIEQLKHNRGDRRAVLAMWDPRVDCNREGKDFPCNTHIYFRVTEDYALNMTICNRSNDLLWGLFGSNFVHFSMLQEFVAQRVGGVHVGKMFTMTNNLHVYTDILPRDKFDDMIINCEAENFYGDDQVFGLDYDLSEINEFIDDPEKVRGYRTQLIAGIAQPMFLAWVSKRYDVNLALHFCRDIVAQDWRIVCEAWLRRYHAKKGRVLKKFQTESKSVPT